MDNMDTNSSTWTPTCNMDNMDPCQVPEELMEIASKPGRLIKGADNIWRPPSQFPNGGRVMMARMVDAWMFRGGGVTS